MSTPIHAALVLAATRPADGEGWIGRWSPGIGDPSLGGWLTVALYLAAAWLCRRCSRRARSGNAPSESDRREARLWAAFALALLFLGVNKQLDLQSAFTELMRMLAREGGWYETRRRYQHLFVAVAAVAALWAATVVAIATHGLDRAVRIGALGLVIVIAFVAVRAMSFHHVDELIGRRILSLRVNWLLEIMGITVVMAGTWLRLRRPARG